MCKLRIGRQPALRGKWSEGDNGVGELIGRGEQEASLGRRPRDHNIYEGLENIIVERG